MKKTIFLFFCIVFASCDQTANLKKQLTDSELEAMILNDANFIESIKVHENFVSMVNTSLNSLSDSQIEKLRNTLKNQTGSVDIFFGAPRTSTSEVIEKLEEICGLDFLAAQQELSTPLRRLYTNLAKQQIDFNQVQRIYKNWILNSHPNTKGFGRSAFDFVACENQAYYCYSVALTTCFNSYSGSDLDGCIGSAGIDFTIAHMGCVVEQLKSDAGGK
ncbi:MAG: hypothetical protein ACK514_16900 [Bacteroidota bacterium]|jgi:hypothetical protein|nr:hypothetical protein [Cytophagales bacterium]MCA6430798.1 hypothetical protein [Cytophagales bacterium]MCE2956020.1 hypothetical protein [Flammeovirgaceae bacterium]MCZ8069099.1 hypothetical protein [Cytophagales bacterium]